MASLRHDTLIVTAADLYTSEVYMGEYTPPSTDVLLGIASQWQLSAAAGDMSIRVDIIINTNVAYTETFTSPKITTGGTTYQVFRVDPILFIPSYATAKFYVRSTSSSDTNHVCNLFLFNPNFASDLGTPATIAVGTDTGELDITAGRVKVDDIYHADINVAVDAAAPQDEYTVTWFKNGARVTSGISSPTIQVVKRADGTSLVPSTAMTEIGSTGSYKKDEGTNLITAGEAVLVIASANIDSATRTFSKVISRDAAA